MTLTPSRSFFRQIARDDWMQNTLVGYCYWLAIPTLTLLLCLVSGEMSFSGKGSAIVGGLTGIVLTLLSLLCYSYVKNKETCEKYIAKWSKTKFTYTFDEEHLSTHRDANFHRTAWSEVKRVQFTRTAMLLHFAASPIALPRENLSEELREFIRSKVKDAGGKTA